MRRLFLAIAICLYAAPALAQTQAIGTENLGWTEAGSSLAEVQAYQYLVADGTAAPVVLTAVTCSGTTSPYACQVRLPALTTGLHSLAVLARTTVNGQVLTSAPSAPLSVLIVAVPAVPQNVRLLP